MGPRYSDWMIVIERAFGYLKTPVSVPGVVRVEDCDDP
jgi:hypothetical protein